MDKSRIANSNVCGARHSAFENLDFKKFLLLAQIKKKQKKKIKHDVDRNNNVLKLLISKEDAGNDIQQQEPSFIVEEMQFYSS